jgi:hypothetical protein
LCLPNWAMLVACANLLQAGKPEEPRYRCKRRAFFLRKRVKLYKKLLIVRGARKPVTHGLETPVGAMQSSNIAAIAHDDQLDDEIVVGYEIKGQDGRIRRPTLIKISIDIAVTTKLS